MDDPDRILCHSFGSTIPPSGGGIQCAAAGWGQYIWGPELSPRLRTLLSASHRQPNPPSEARDLGPVALGQRSCSRSTMATARSSSRTTTGVRLRKPRSSPPPFRQRITGKPRSSRLSQRGPTLPWFARPTTDRESHWWKSTTWIAPRRTRGFCSSATRLWRGRKEAECLPVSQTSESSVATTRQLARRLWSRFIPARVSKGELICVGVGRSGDPPASYFCLPSP